MADDLLARRAATYGSRESKPAEHLARAQPPPEAPRAPTQTERQAGTYAGRPEGPPRHLPPPERRPPLTQTDRQAATYTQQPPEKGNVGQTPGELQAAADYEARSRLMTQTQRQAETYGGPTTETVPPGGLQEVYRLAEESGIDASAARRFVNGFLKLDDGAVAAASAPTPVPTEAEFRTQWEAWRQAARTDPELSTELRRALMRAGKEAHAARSRRRAK